LLEGRVVKSKRTLDSELAAKILPKIPNSKKNIWLSSSIYGKNQTLGEGIVSFLLRPLSFMGLITFGKRDGSYPTFVSPKNWMHDKDVSSPLSHHEAIVQLVRKYLHCYGPSTIKMFSE